MEIDQSSSEKQPPKEKSFTVALEQMAQLLRTEIKLQDRQTKAISPSSLSPSLKNLVAQVAKMLRSQVHLVKSSKKRSWTKGK